MASEQMAEPLLGSGKERGDLEEIRSSKQFLKHWVEENKRLWYLAGPSIFTSICRYSLGATTQVFAGHLTTLELDAVSTENMVIAGLAFGIMVMQPIRSCSLSCLNILRFLPSQIRTRVKTQLCAWICIQYVYWNLILSCHVMESAVFYLDFVDPVHYFEQFKSTSISSALINCRIKYAL